jgi:hypothetical protein
VAAAALKEIIKGDSGQCRSICLQKNNKLTERLERKQTEVRTAIPVYEHTYNKEIQASTNPTQQSF